MQVIEIITKRTLQGEETSYILQAGSDQNSKVGMDQIDGEVFESHEVARKTLVNRASQQINRLIDMAIAKSAEWYNIRPDHQTAVTHDKITNDLMDTVILPDGTVAKVTLPNF